MCTMPLAENYFLLIWRKIDVLDLHILNIILAAYITV